MVVETEESMTDNHQQEYCTTKDLGKAFAVLVFMIIGVPIIMLMLMVGPEEYAKQCNLSPLPCFGLKVEQ